MFRCLLQDTGVQASLSHFFRGGREPKQPSSQSSQSSATHRDQAVTASGSERSNTSRKRARSSKAARSPPSPSLRKGTHKRSRSVVAIRSLPVRSPTSNDNPSSVPLPDKSGGHIEEALGDAGHSSLPLDTTKRGHASRHVDELQSSSFSPRSGAPHASSQLRSPPSADNDVVMQGGSFPGAQNKDQELRDKSLMFSDIDFNPSPSEKEPTVASDPNFSEHEHKHDQSPPGSDSFSDTPVSSRSRSRNSRSSGRIMSAPRQPAVASSSAAAPNSGDVEAMIDDDVHSPQQPPTETLDDPSAEKVCKAKLFGVCGLHRSLTSTGVQRERNKPCCVRVDVLISYSAQQACPTHATLPYTHATCISNVLILTYRDVSSRLGMDYLKVIQNPSHA